MNSSHLKIVKVITLIAIVLTAAAFSIQRRVFPTIDIKIPQSSTRAAYSLDGTFLVTIHSNENFIWVWNSDSGGEVKRISVAQPQTRIIFSPDRKHFATLSDDNSILVWSMSSWQVETILSSNTKQFDIVYSPDGHFIYAAGLLPNSIVDGAIYVWDTKTQERSEKFTWQSSSVYLASVELALSVDGMLLAIGDSEDNDAGTVQLLSTSSSSKVAQFSIPAAVLSMAWSPRGNYFAVGGQDLKVRIWDATTFKEIKSLSHKNGPINALAFSPDEKYIVSGGNHQPTTIWSTDTWQTWFELKDIYSTGMIHNIVYSPDGCQLVTSKVDRDQSTTDIWNVPSCPQ